MITILAVPRTGTRFFGNFVANVIGLPLQYAHFCSENKDAIAKYLADTKDVIIVPVRSYGSTARSFGYKNREMVQDSFAVLDYFTPMLYAHGAHFIDTVKTPETPDQIRAFLIDVNTRWTSDVTDFVREWEPIGSQHNCNARSAAITEQMLKLKAFERNEDVTHQ